MAKERKPYLLDDINETARQMESEQYLIDEDIIKPKTKKKKTQQFQPEDDGIEKLDPNMSAEEAEKYYSGQALNEAPRKIEDPGFQIITPGGGGNSGGNNGGNGDNGGSGSNNINGDDGEGSGPNPDLPKTLSETLESSTDMTDMQYAAYRLMPPKLGSEVKNANMIGRVDPNIYLARLHLNSVDEIMTSDPRKAINVNEIWNKNEILLSIGLDGMGRIDLLELAGAAREEKRIEKTFAGLGSSGL
jgi:hypothetical protein